MKNVWKYITISFLLLLGLGCAGVLYIFFVPGSSLFHITYINNNIRKESEKFNAADIETIKINSRAYEVQIYETEEDTIYLHAHSNSFGFVLDKYNSFELKTELDYSTLTFTIIEPHGFATPNSSLIKLYVPTTENYNLHLSNFKAKTTIDTPNATFENIKYSTTKGNLNINNATLLGDLNLNLGKSDCKISSNVTTDENNVTLQLTSGSFKAKDVVLGDINITKNERGVITLGTCNDINSNHKSSGGQINAETIKHASITAGDTIISINEVTAAVSIDMKKSGRVQINKLSGISSILTNSGNIILGTTLSPVTLRSESGNITVSNAFMVITLTNLYGESTINFDKTAPSNRINASSRVLYASIKNGSLTATGVEHIGEIKTTTDQAPTGGIKITGNGRVNIFMNNINGKNSVNAGNGSLKVVVNKDSSYILSTQSSGGAVRVNLTQTSEYNGYTDKDLTTTNVNCSTSSNTLSATVAKGYLTILDTNFA